MTIQQTKIFQRFNKSPLGRSLGVHGEKVQRLALHLLTQAEWNCAGSYPRSLASMQAATRLPTRSLLPRLRLLEQIGFCTYDFDHERVSVPLLAQLYQRLWPKKSLDTFCKVKDTSPTTSFTQESNL